MSQGTGMDLLSELLRDVRVEASAMTTFCLSAPFHLAIRYDLPYSLTVLRGDCLWQDDRGETHRLQAGDAILVLQPGRCALASDFSVPAQSLGEVWDAQGLPQFHGARDFAAPLHLRCGGDGPAVELLGIAFAFADRHRSPLMEALPAMFTVPLPSSPQAAGVEAAIAFLNAEGERAQPGYAALAAHHAETVFLGLLRAHALSEDGLAKGLLACLRDRHLAPALKALHAQPGAGWTVQRLADAAALSRSAFAERFSTGMGMAPMQYVAALRMGLARQWLAEDNLPVARLAESLGYASERAFRAAFQREVGQPPGAWQRALRRQR